MEDIVAIGDMVTVKVLDIDKTGKISLSMKALQMQPMQDDYDVVDVDVEAMAAEDM